MRPTWNCSQNGAAKAGCRPGAIASLGGILGVAHVELFFGRYLLIGLDALRRQIGVDPRRHGRLPAQ